MREHVSTSGRVLYHSSCATMLARAVGYRSRATDSPTSSNKAIDGIATKIERASLFSPKTFVLLALFMGARSSPHRSVGSLMGFCKYERPDRRSNLKKRHPLC